MNARTRQVIFFSALLAIPIASYVMVFAPRTAAIKEALVDIQTRQARLDRLAVVMAEVPNLEVALDRGEALISKVEAKLPRRQDVEVILERIWQMARRQDLTVRSVKTQDTKSSGVYMEQPLEVDMAGPFEGFYRFLLELEGLPRITRVSDLMLKEATRSMRGPGDEPPRGAVTAKFVLRIYFADSVPAIAMVERQ